MIQLQSTQSLKVTRSTTEFFKAGMYWDCQGWRMLT